jgi:hypothetical protein
MGPRTISDGGRQRRSARLRHRGSRKPVREHERADFAERTSCGIERKQRDTRVVGERAEVVRADFADDRFAVLLGRSMRTSVKGAIKSSVRLIAQRSSLSGSSARSPSPTCAPTAPISAASAVSSDTGNSRLGKVELAWTVASSSGPSAAPRCRLQRAQRRARPPSRTKLERVPAD